MFSFLLISLLYTLPISTEITNLSETSSSKGSIAKPVSTNETSEQPVGWRYEKAADPAGGSIDKAILTADNLVQLAYPYAGGSSITLTMRYKKSGTHVYMEVSKGMFTPSFQNTKAQIRFDAGSPKTYVLTASANGRGNIVFFEAGQELIKQIKGAKKMTLQMQFIDKSKQEISFNTAGLRWSH